MPKPDGTHEYNRVVVLLVGGRLTPNVIGILALRPCAVEMVVSTDTPGQCEVARKVLQTIDSVVVCDQPEFVSAYHMAECEKACQVVAERHPGTEIWFDASSCPKIMAFAGYEVARQRGQHAIIVDTTHQQVIDVTHKGAVAAAIPLTLEQYLACYGRRPRPMFDFARLSVSYEQAMQAATYLANAGPRLLRLLPRFRNWSQGKGERHIEFNRTQPLDDDQRAILRSLADLRLLAGYDERPDHRVAYTIRSDEDYNFLNGTWLEVFVRGQVARQNDAQGSPLFSECAFSLEIPSEGACKEIDVACLYQGQLVLCSCKTEVKPFETEYLDELYAVSNLVGGEFASRIFVTNVLPPTEDDPPAHREYLRFMEQAKDRKTVVVTGDRLADVGKTLAQQATNPDYKRI
jgi:hypothetical protein